MLTRFTEGETEARGGPGPNGFTRGGPGEPAPLTHSPSLRTERGPRFPRQEGQTLRHLLGPLLKTPAEPVLEPSPQMTPGCTAVCCPLGSDACSVTDLPPGCRVHHRDVGSGWADATGRREASGKESATAPELGPCSTCPRGTSTERPKRRNLGFHAGHGPHFPLHRSICGRSPPLTFLLSWSKLPSSPSRRLEAGRKNRLSGSTALMLGVHLPVALKTQKTAPEKVADVRVFYALRSQAQRTLLPQGRCLGRGCVPWHKTALQTGSRGPEGLPGGCLPTPHPGRRPGHLALRRTHA